MRREFVCFAVEEAIPRPQVHHQQPPVLCVLLVAIPQPLVHLQQPPVLYVRLAATAQPQLQ